MERTAESGTLVTYVADPASTPWRRGATEGITFNCQVLLGGEDGGPEAIRFRFDPTLSVYAHMHLTAQFQLLIGGSMNFSRDALNLRPVGVHYTDHNTPYGPFSVGEEHDVLVLHPRQGGLMTMGNRTARREINLAGRVLQGLDSEMEWTSVAGAPDVRYKVLIPHAFGPEVVMLECAPGLEVPVESAPYGRYEVVLSGSMIADGRELGPPGFRYALGEERPAPVRAGPEGATLIFLTFDANAFEGGLTGEGIALDAAEAMAQAI